MTNISLGILSWRAHETLRKTLDSYRIAVGDGCFTHNRFDDSFRKTHPAYNASI